MAKFTSTVNDPANINFNVSVPNSMGMGEAYAIQSIANLGKAGVDAYAAQQKAQRDLQAQLAKEKRAEERTIRTEERAEERRLAQKAEEEARELREATSLSGLQTSLGEMTEQAQGANEALTILQQAQDKEEGARLETLRRDYAKLVQAEQLGMRGSVAARKEALVRQFIAENPLLRSEAMELSGKYDALTEIGIPKSQDPMVAAQQEVNAAASKLGVNSKTIIEVNQLENDDKLTSLKLKIAKDNSEVQESDLYAAANAFKLKQSAAIQGAVLKAIKEQGDNFDSATLLAKLKGETEQTAGLKFQELKELGSDLRLGSEFWRGIEQDMTSGMFDIVEPLMAEKDPAAMAAKAKTWAADKTALLNNMTLESYLKDQPNMRLAMELHGKEGSLTMAGAHARALQTVQSDQKQHKFLLKNDPEYAYAFNFFQNGPANAFNMRMANGGSSTGMPKVDQLADLSAISAFNSNQLNQSGTETMFKNVLANGFSNSNRRLLLSDAAVLQLRRDDESKKALKNFTANSFMGELVRMQPMIDELGIEISFDPQQTTRIKDGPNYQPSQAFTARMPDGSVVDRDVRTEFIPKLNTLYTLLGTFTPADELETLGKSMFSRLDRESPKFIEDSVNREVGKLQRLRDTLAAQYDRIPAGLRTNEYVAQQAQKKQEMIANYDNLIQLQKDRLKPVAAPKTPAPVETPTTEQPTTEKPKVVKWTDL